jgi:hypothetical protein
MNENLGELRINPQPFARPLTRPGVRPTLRLDPRLLSKGLSATPGPTASAPTLAPPPAAEAVATVFDQLPFPQAGDRIRAEDFRTLSQALVSIADAYALSSGLLGRTYGDARPFLTAQQYVIERVLTVFGAEAADPNDTSLDSRTVLSVTPVRVGDRRLAILLSEAVDTRRLSPDLLGLTHREAAERVRSLVGDALPGAAIVIAPDLVGLSANNAAAAVGHG